MELNEAKKKFRKLGFRYGGKKPRGCGFSVYFWKGEIGKAEVLRMPFKKM